MTEDDLTELPDGGYATWRGRGYQGSVRGPATVLLTSERPEKGFEPNRTGRVWGRTVPRSETEVWRLWTSCRWRDLPCAVRGVTGDRTMLQTVAGRVTLRRLREGSWPTGGVVLSSPHQEEQRPASPARCSTPVRTGPSRWRTASGSARATPDALPPCGRPSTTPSPTGYRPASRARRQHGCASPSATS